MEETSVYIFSLERQVLPHWRRLECLWRGKLDCKFTSVEETGVFMNKSGSLVVVLNTQKVSFNSLFFSACNRVTAFLVSQEKLQRGGAMKR